MYETYNSILTNPQDFLTIFSAMLTIIFIYNVIFSIWIIIRNSIALTVENYLQDY